LIRNFYINEGFVLAHSRILAKLDLSKRFLEPERVAKIEDKLYLKNHFSLNKLSECISIYKMQLIDRRHDFFDIILV
jgi:hypothetical protein